jgi:hypothetical protein
MPTVSIPNRHAFKAAPAMPTIIGAVLAGTAISGMTADPFLTWAYIGALAKAE